MPEEHPALRYFLRRYPGRERWLGSQLFRAGEAARRRAVRRALPGLDGLDVLDVGCGDGVFLSSVVEGRPRLLRLEDLVVACVQAAQRRMRGRAERVESGVVDSARTVDERTFDVVMAIGVADYQRDWVRFIGRLLRRTRGRLIIDVPRTDDLRNQVRRLWLWGYGIRLQTATRRALGAGLGPLAPSPVVQVTRHSWVLCLDR
ncbi:MAG: class I SAM-dependent methyltransferase [Candidatus Latescibacterota bacterium]